MNTADIDKRLHAIEEAAAEGDHERAGNQEASLFVAVLEAIADGSAAEPQRLAELALQSRNVQFPRRGA